MIELKPCPFCGGEAGVFYRKQGYDAPAYGVTCMCCSAKVFGYSLREGAERAWNRRAEK